MFSLFAILKFKLGLRSNKFLFLDFSNSLVSGSSSVLARIELFPVVAVVANEVCNLADAWNEIGCLIGTEWGSMVFLATFVSSERRGSRRRGTS